VRAAVRLLDTYNLMATSRTAKVWLRGGRHQANISSDEPTQLSQWGGLIAFNIVSDIRQCEWFSVYDIIEAVAQHLIQKGWNEAAERFQEAMNAYFREAGIGWQLVDGVIEIRGPEAFESSVRGAIVTLEASNKPIAQQEFHEALRDLSRRPEPDLTGAVQHAIAALECVARDVSGDSKATLGVLLDKKRISLPPPLDEAAAKLWGYACNMARHINEGNPIAYEEAELLVAIASALATYLTKKAV
jgi:AbiJ-like protein